MSQKVEIHPLECPGNPGNVGNMERALYSSSWLVAILVIYLDNCISGFPDFQKPGYSLETTRN